MEGIKLWYLRSLLHRTPTPETSLEHLVKNIRAVEQLCSDCYDDESNLSSDQFVEVMVVDGCFIVEFMLKTERRECVTDSVTENLWIRSPLISDLFLLKNQLPWRLVLECLFQLIKENTCNESVGKYTSLSELTHKIMEFALLAI
ncbi:hypothetical protein RchiOBHm_Chr2g0163511 [Rosa chinensis]|uniref:Uncharacterized protein n=1 Tax=Rosa chinensis TaxID=74649 RepID=A0A2P6S3A8_ROSCH|nr:hypothetical protein RchiOBHm_Chr2g0163511 [Rosa chinensis]